LNACSISVALFVAALRHLRLGDIAIVVTNPPLLPSLIVVACWIRGARRVVLVHDVYPEALYVAGILRRNSTLGAIADRIGVWTYRMADRLVVLGQDMKALAAKKLGGRTDNILLIPNWADLDVIRPAVRMTNPVLQQAGIADKWVIQCSGNMSRTHDLTSVVEAAAQLAVADATVHFLLIGSGAQFEMLRAAARTLPNLTIVPRRPRSELADVLNACDVGLVSLAAGMGGVSVPSRVYNILAAGKPIIAVADAESEVARLIREANVGWIVPPRRPDLLVAAVQASRVDLAHDREMPRRARRLAERYSRARALDAYDAMIGDLASNPNGSHEQALTS
jgi:glycosyltransferase involved in cell wall biosynthesis